MNRMFAAVSSLVAFAGAYAAQPLYVVVDLGEIPASTGCPCFSPTAMSEGGFVVGSYYAPNNDRRSFRWQGVGAAGVMRDIGTLGSIAQAADVNNAGVAVGYSVDPQSRQRPIKFDGQTMVALPTLPTGIHGNANAINNQGWIVGMSQKMVNAETWERAVVWMPNSAPIDLGTFGGPFAQALGVNDLGQVVGYAWNAQWRQRAFVWSAASGLVDIGTLGGVSATAADINEHGMVVGMADNASGIQRAYVWTAASGMVELAAPASVLSSYATGVNNAGQVVGNALLETCQGAGLLWSGGQMYDLNALIVPGTGWTVEGASDIADNGQIAATARLNNAGSSHAVLLMPVMKPSFSIRR